MPINKEVNSIGIREFGNNPDNQYLYEKLVGFFNRIKKTDRVEDITLHYKNYIGLLIIILSHYVSLMDIVESNYKNMTEEERDLFKQFHIHLRKLVQNNFPEHKDGMKVPYIKY